MRVTKSHNASQRVTHPYPGTRHHQSERVTTSPRSVCFTAHGHLGGTARVTKVHNAAHRVTIPYPYTRQKKSARVTASHRSRRKCCHQTQRVTMPALFLWPMAHCRVTTRQITRRDELQIPHLLTGNGVRTRLHSPFQHRQLHFLASKRVIAAFICNHCHLGA